MSRPTPWPDWMGRGYRRRVWYGLLTVLGLAERGYFIPHRHAGASAAPRGRRPYGAIEDLLAQQEAQFSQVLGWLDDMMPDLARIPIDSPDDAEPTPRWAQSWFPRLDAAVAYALVRHYGPRRVVEIGSGHSTRFVARAIADGNLACRITAIDPAPRAELPAAVDLRQVRVQSLPPEEVADLQAGDILMIDSSHILMPGSDVDYLLARVLPLLPAGVLVQFHDIFLPDDYPKVWDWRGYNEQLGVLPLIRDAGWDVIFASRYAVTRMPAAVLECAISDMPLLADAFESSLWLRVR